MEMIVVTPVRERFAETPVEQHWLWCSECERFFHRRSVVVDRGGTPRCPLPDCQGYGFDYNLLCWDSYREPADPRWPRSTADLHHGRRSPDMAPFYEQRARYRHAQLILAFESSPERDALGVPPLRFVAPFLWMQHCCAWDADDDFYDEELAYLAIRDLPRWADAGEPADRRALLAELRAFWTFAARTQLLPMATEWLALLDHLAAKATERHRDRRAEPMRPEEAR